MDFRRLNPIIREAGIYESISRTDACRAYDARLIYLISGDIAVQIEEEKKFHLSVGNLLYIPAGVKYKLKGKYLRAAVFNLDITSESPDPVEKIPAVAAEEFDEEQAHIFAQIEPFDKVLLLEDAEAERERRNPSGGRRPVRTEAMPEQKIYSGTVLRPAGSAER